MRGVQPGTAAAADALAQRRVGGDGVHHREGDGPEAGRRAHARLTRNSRGDSHVLSTRLHEERRAGAAQPWLRAGVPGAHRRSGGRGAAQGPDHHLPARRGGRPQHGRAVRRARLLRRASEHRHSAAERRPTAPSISTASSASTRGWRRSSRCGTRASWRSSTRRARPTARARTSTRRTTWSRRRPA